MWSQGTESKTEFWDQGMKPTFDVWNQGIEFPTYFRKPDTEPTSDFCNEVGK